MSAIENAIGALMYLAENPRPVGGECTYNSLHLRQIIDQLQRLTGPSIKGNVKLPASLAKNIKDEGYYRAVCDMMDCIRAAGGKMEGDE